MKDITQFDKVWTSLHNSENYHPIYAYVFICIYFYKNIIIIILSPSWQLICVYTNYQWMCQPVAFTVKWTTSSSVFGNQRQNYTNTGSIKFNKFKLNNTSVCHKFITNKQLEWKAFCNVLLSMYFWLFMATEWKSFKYTVCSVQYNTTLVWGNKGKTTHSSPKSWWLYSGWKVVPSSSTSSGKRTAITFYLLLM